MKSWRWKPLHDGLSALTRRGDQSHVRTFSTMWGHSKKAAICKTGSRPSLDKEPDGTLILKFPTSRTVRNQCYCLSHSVYVFCYRSPSGLRHMPFSARGCCTCSFSHKWEEKYQKKPQWVTRVPHLFLHDPFCNNSLLPPDDWVDYLCQNGDSFPCLLVPEDKEQKMPTWQL